MDRQSELMLEEEPEAVQADPEAKDPVRVLMAAGGTGGHIFPALAVAEEMRRRSKAAASGRTYETIFVGTGKGLEARVIPQAGYALRTISAAGLKGIKGMKRIVNLARLPRSAYEAAQVLREIRPGVVMGVGGYIAGPVMLEAALAGIPTLLFEPNAVPGLTNRLLAPVVGIAAVGFKQATAAYGGKARLTGHPVRQDFYRAVPKVHLAPYTLLVVGGSQGARALNHHLMEALPLFRQSLGGTLRFIHQTGGADYNAVEAVYAGQGAEADVYRFIDNIAEAFSRADLVVCRAGATTVAELAAAGKASILIPYPSASDQHQLENARVLERAGGAQVIEQKNLSPQRLVDEVSSLLRDSERLASMERGARSLARPDAAGRIADLIEELVSRKQGV